MRDRADKTVLTGLRVWDPEGLNGTREAVEVFADNAAALAAGMEIGEVYRRADGTLMIVYPPV